MADETPEIQRAPDPVVPPAAVAPSYDPAEIETLRARAAAADQYEATLRYLEPHADKIQRIVQDDGYSSFVDQSWSAYENMQKAQKPPEAEAPEWFKPYAAQLDGERENKARAEREQQEKWQRDEMDFAARLVAEQPHLKENNGIVRVAAFADSMAKIEKRPVGIEEAWKTMQGFAPASAPPAPSLRADSGSVGIPDRAPANNTNFTKDFHGEMLSRLKRAKNAS